MRPKRRTRSAERAERAWQLFLDLLRTWVRRKGHASVPHRARVGNFALGQVVTRRRREFRYGWLTPEQMRECESFPGWTWEPIDERFRRRVQWPSASTGATGTFVYRAATVRRASA